jgi:hypothetical protein
MAHRAYRFVAKQVNLAFCHVVVTLSPHLRCISTKFTACMAGKGNPVRTGQKNLSLHHLQSSRKQGIISLAVLSHHRTCRSAYGGLSE